LSVLQPAVDSAVFYYLDSPMTAKQAADLSEDGPAVLIGQGSIAKYLDQPQIVTSSRPNEINYSETQRWAEPLDENITRVLIDHLALELGTSQVGFLRALRSMEWDYRIGYHIYHLTGAPGGTLRMQASWWIEQRDGGTKRIHEFIAEEPVDGDPSDYTAYVRTIETVIANWAREVAKAIK
jgi:uncharacterized lipoprotein YmbA